MCVCVIQVIKDYQLFMVVGILLAVDLTIMTTWQIADPFYRAIKQMEPYVSKIENARAREKKKDAEEIYRTLACKNFGILVYLKKKLLSITREVASRLQHHPSSEDIIIIPENEYCQSNQMNIYLFCIYIYKGLLMVSC